MQLQGIIVSFIQPINEEKKTLKRTVVTKILL